MRSAVVRAAWYGIGIVALVLSAQGYAQATPPVAVPEIDENLVATGVGVLAASVLIVRAWRAK